MAVVDAGGQEEEEEEGEGGKVVVDAGGLAGEEGEEGEELGLGYGPLTVRESVCSGSLFEATIAGMVCWPRQHLASGQLSEPNPKHSRTNQDRFFAPFPFQSTCGLVMSCALLPYEEEGGGGGAGGGGGGGACGAQGISLVPLSGNTLLASRPGPKQRL